MAMLYMDGIPVNSAVFSDGETWFELHGTIGTAGRTFSFMHAADGFAETAGTELCEGKRLVEADVDCTEEIADVELDCAGTYIR